MRRNQRGFVFLPILIILILIGAVGYFAYQNYQLKQDTPSSIVESELTPTVAIDDRQPTTTSAPISPTPTSDPTVGWKSLSNSSYSFKYPPYLSVNSIPTPDWYDPNYIHESGRVELRNKQKSVGIIVSAGEYPFGFGGEIKQTTTPLAFTINNQTVEAEEVVINDSSLYVSTDINVGSTRYTIVFGTGYPTTEERLESLSDYYEIKDDILKILSTFEFTN